MRIYREPITIYRNGPFIDLCRGPHIPATNKIKQIRLLKTSASHWKSGDASAVAEMEGEEHLLQRIYGIAFGTKNGMKAWEKRLNEAKMRDHRKIGVQQGMYLSKCCNWCVR